MHYLLTYHYSADYLQRRGEFRNGHLAGAWAAQGRGELVLGGKTGNPPDSAVFMFDCADPSVIEAFVQPEPLCAKRPGAAPHHVPVAHGGGEASHTPVRPE